MENQNNNESDGLKEYIKINNEIKQFLSPILNFSEINDFVIIANGKLKNLDNKIGFNYRLDGSFENVIFNMENLKNILWSDVNDRRKWLSRSNFNLNDLENEKKSTN